MESSFRLKWTLTLDLKFPKWVLMSEFNNRCVGLHFSGVVIMNVWNALQCT